MLFNTVPYAFFFAAVFAVVWALRIAVPVAARLALAALLAGLGAFAELRASWPVALPLMVGAGAMISSALSETRTSSGLAWVRTVFLLVVSYGFYAAWDWHYLPLIFASSTVDYWLAHAVARERRPGRRKAIIVATVALNLGFLGFFKYWNFALENWAALTGSSAGAHDALRVLLPPVGISFFTFESMSYVIDVYRGDLEPHPSYLRYLLFVSFFPHLVAGPIVRPRDLLPQLAAEPVLSREDSGEALFLIAVGLVKKIAIADQLAVNIVERVFESPSRFSALEVLGGVYGYAAQIYCDFSGYTDIAIGSALLLGVRFPKNFDAPYKSRDIAEFWRRWHISLSSWLRDYLYIPLGGNRGGELATYRNLMITMVLGGLWHGPAWTFVIWGALHGGALAVTRLWQRARGSGNAGNAGDAKKPRAPWYAPGALLATFFTFHFVCFAWVFFRAKTFGGAVAVLKQLGTLTTFAPNLPPFVLAVLVAGIASHFVPERAFEGAKRAFARTPPAAQGALLFAVAVFLHEIAATEQVPFVYFQF